MSGLPKLIAILAVALVAFPGIARANPPCGEPINDNEMMIDKPDGTSYSIKLTVYRLDGTVVKARRPNESTYTHSEMNGVNRPGSCDLRIDWDGNCGGITTTDYCLEERPNEPFRFTVRSSAFAAPGNATGTRSFMLASNGNYSTDSNGDPVVKSFFAPNRKTASGDQDVYVEVVPYSFNFSYNRDWDDFVNDNFTHDDWIAPYQLNLECDLEYSVNCDHYHSAIFLTRQIIPFNSDPVFRIRGSINRNPFISTDDVRDFWHDDGLVLRFDSGRDLQIYKTLSLDGVVLEAYDGASGWKGLRFNSGSSGALTDVSISDVKSGWSGHAVYVANAQLDLDGTTIDGTGGDGGIYITGTSADVSVHGNSVIDGEGIDVINGTLTLDGAQVFNAGTGVYATGSSADVTITGGSRIIESGSVGVHANSGADVTIKGQSEVNQSGLYGVRARGSGTTILIQDAFVQESAYYATHTDMYAELDLRNTPTAAKLNTNDAGVAAELVGETDTGTAGGNRIVRNPLGPPPSQGTYQDIFTMDMAYVDVRNTYWGPGITSASQLAITDGEDNVVLVTPVLTTDPAGGTGSLRTSGTNYTMITDGGETINGRMGDASVQNGPFASQRGTGSTQGWVEAAEGSTGNEAVDAVQSALNASETDAERRMAWAAAARLAIRMKTRPEQQNAGASARLDAFATSSLLDAADSPWARRVLALSAFHGDSRAAAREHLDLLARIPSEHHKVAKADEASPLSHAAFAHLLTIQEALATQDTTGALEALTALAATDAYQARMAEDDIRVAFPEAEATAARIRGTEQARRERVYAEEALPSATALAVAPNPSAGPIQVTVALAEVAEVDLAVYDALGRRVRVVMQGSMEAGSHRSDVDLTGLPAGVYLVRMTAGERTETVRFTLAR